MLPLLREHPATEIYRNQDRFSGLFFDAIRWARSPTTTRPAPPNGNASPGQGEHPDVQCGVLLMVATGLEPPAACARKTPRHLGQLQEHRLRHPPSPASSKTSSPSNTSPTSAACGTKTSSEASQQLDGDDETRCWGICRRRAGIVGRKRGKKGASEESAEIGQDGHRPESHRTESVGIRPTPRHWNSSSLHWNRRLKADTFKSTHDEVLRRVGRNLLLFQQVEGLLKVLLANHKGGGSLFDFKAPRRPGKTHQKQMLGQLVENYGTEVLQDDSVEVTEEKEPAGMASFAIRIQCDAEFLESVRRDLKLMTEEPTS